MGFLVFYVLNVPREADSVILRQDWKYCMNHPEINGKPISCYNLVLGYNFFVFLCILLYLSRIFFLRYDLVVCYCDGLFIFVCK